MKPFILIILLAVFSMSIFNGVLYYQPNPKNPDDYDNGFESVIDSVKIMVIVILLTPYIKLGARVTQSPKLYVSELVPGNFF